MKPRGPERRYKPHPRAGARPAHLVWLVWALGTVGMVVVAMTFMLFQSTYPAVHSYVGTLRQSGDPFEISLPAGAILEHVDVSAGNRIAQGETIFTLDLPAMRATFAVLDERLDVIAYLMRCIQEYEPPPDLGETDGFLEARYDNARSDCAEHHSNTGEEIRYHEAQIALQKEERALLENYLALEAGLSDEATGEGVRRLVGLRLARNALDQSILGHQDSIRRIKRMAQLTAAQRTRVLLREASDASTQRARVERMMMEPRVRTGQSGLVTHVRAYSASAALSHDLPLVSAIGTESTAFEVSFNAPIQDIGLFSHGTIVDITILGLDDSPGISGTVAAISEADEGELVINVHIDQDIAARMAQGRTGLAFRGVSTASLVEVTRRKDPFLPHLVAAAKAATPTSWLSRLSAR